MLLSRIKHTNKSTSLLTALRDATNNVHERLHVHPLTCRLTSPELRPERYINVLRAFYGFYKPCAPYSEAAASRVAWLEKDLHYYGCDCEDIPICLDVPSLQTEPEKQGFLYVVEGSGLGSQVISKHLRKSLGVEPNAGGCFFYAHGSKTGECWRNVRALLQAQPKRQQDALIHAACQTFSILERWLTSCNEAGV